jgi:tetratricopeptide (TPR) repeat protein
MYRSVSYSLAALLLFSGCGAKPTEKQDPKQDGAVLTTTPEPTKTVTQVEEAKPKKPPKKKTPPKEDKKLTTTEKQQYYKALNEGRTAHRAKDFTAAIAAFDKALALFPDDPRALSEKGWSEFGAKDLKAAASDTNNAIGRTTNKDLLGSSYYNLGRIREDEQKTDKAVEAYQESLKVRPGNKIVEARLTGLKASLVEKGSLAGPYMTFTGPFADTKELCKEVSKTDDPSTKITCDAEAAEPLDGEKTIVGSGSIKSVKIFASQTGYLSEGETETSYYPEANYHLGIQTAEGWYLLKDLEYVYNPGAFGIFEDFTVDPFELKDIVPGGEPEILLVATHSRGDSDMGINEYETNASTDLIICGIGASKKPSCAQVTVKSENERSIIDEDTDKELKADDPEFKHEGLYKNAWTLDWSFTPDGKLQIKGTPSKSMDDETKALIGIHTLTFE